MRLVPVVLGVALLAIVAASFLLAACARDPAPPPSLAGVTATIVDGDGEGRFSAVATALEAGPDGAVAHGVAITHAGSDTVVLDDARFAHHVEQGEGHLVTAGRGCGASWEDGRVVHICTDDLQVVVLRPGDRHDYPVTVWARLGPLSASPGTYTLEQRIAWWVAEQGDPGQARQREPDGELVVQLTYEVLPVIRQLPGS